MGEFFKPWRRKIGVVTLVATLAISCGWLRSIRVSESLSFYDVNETGRCELVLLESLEQSLHLCVRERQMFEGMSDIGIRNFWYESSEIPSERWLPLAARIAKIKRAHGSVSLCGFAFGCPVDDIWEGDDLHFTEAVVPYWSIVIPLTLLSAYLLLSKPRVAKPKQVGDK